MTAGDGERIVHLYRWDNYEDANGACAMSPRSVWNISSRREAPPQENTISIHACGSAQSVWNDQRIDTGEPAFPNVGNASNAV